jgi:hypothetical protein
MLKGYGKAHKDKSLVILTTFCLSVIKNVMKKGA